MSNFNTLTKNPESGSWENAEWLDNHYGNHGYGVRFPNGKIYDPKITRLETETDAETDAIRLYARSVD